jgi:hypothetical protein
LKIGRKSIWRKFGAPHARFVWPDDIAIGLDHMDEFEAKILSQFRQIIDEVREKKITRQEAQARLLELAGTIEEGQWRIIDDLRTRAPKDESELARTVADLLEAELRKGSGSA